MTLTLAAVGGLDGILSGTLPSLGALAGLVVLAVLLLRREAQTDARYTAELVRMAAQHDAEMTELRAENERLRSQRDAAEESARVCWRSHPGPATAQPR